ncbi:MAG: SPFH domain-containing protein [Planctomycetota bacterium]
MKNVGTVFAAAVVALVLLGYMCTFQVRYTEVAIRKTWGHPDRTAITEPGLYFKWPRPIQSVMVYDKRLHILEDRTEETRTGDGKNLLLTTFTLWRIKDAAKFHTSFPGGIEDGQKKLQTTVYTHKHSVVGKRRFSDFVSTDPSERKIREIEKEMMTAIARDAAQEYGMEVADFGIKKLGLPPSVTSSIFESMKEHESTKAKTYITEGEARATDILSSARAVEERIMAAARRKVAEVQTDAQEVVSEFYKEFDEHPKLRIFLDKLRTVQNALRQRTSLILDTQQAPWDVLETREPTKGLEGARE